MEAEVQAAKGGGYSQLTEKEIQAATANRRWRQERERMLDQQAAAAVQERDKAMMPVLNHVKKLSCLEQDRQEEYKRVEEMLEDQFNERQWYESVRKKDEAAYAQEKKKAEAEGLEKFRTEVERNNAQEEKYRGELKRMNEAQHAREEELLDKKRQEFNSRQDRDRELAKKEAKRAERRDEADRERRLRKEEAQKKRMIEHSKRQQALEAEWKKRAAIQVKMETQQRHEDEWVQMFHQAIELQEGRRHENEAEDSNFNKARERWQRLERQEEIYPKKWQRAVEESTRRKRAMVNQKWAKRHGNEIHQYLTNAEYLGRSRGSRTERLMVDSSSPRSLDDWALIAPGEHTISTFLGECNTTGTTAYQSKRRSRSSPRAALPADPANSGIGLAPQWGSQRGLPTTAAGRREVLEKALEAVAECAEESKHSPKPIYPRAPDMAYPTKRHTPRGNTSGKGDPYRKAFQSLHCASPTNTVLNTTEPVQLHPSRQPQIETGVARLPTNGGGRRGDSSGSSDSQTGSESSTSGSRTPTSTSRDHGRHYQHHSHHPQRRGYRASDSSSSPRTGDYDSSPTTGSTTSSGKLHPIHAELTDAFQHALSHH